MIRPVTLPGETRHSAATYKRPATGAQLPTLSAGAIGAALTMQEPRYLGPVIITRYLGPTNTRGSRISATHKRDSETTWRAVIAWDHALNPAANHQAAAMALLAKWPLGEGQEPFELVARGHDHDAYYFTAVQPWQLQEVAS